MVKMFLYFGHFMRYICILGITLTSENHKIRLKIDKAGNMYRKYQELNFMNLKDTKNETVTFSTMQLISFSFIFHLLC